MNRIAQALPGHASPRHVLGIQDVADDLDGILRRAGELRHDAAVRPSLAGRAVVLWFDRPSTRTRISLEVGLQRLGAVTTVLDAGSSQLSRGESLEDTASVLSRYADAILYRARSHAALEAVARHATVPVINALTEREHPLQTLADWSSLQQAWGSLTGRTFAYVGDGNNVAASYLLGAPMAGMDVQVATPPGHGIDAGVVAEARRSAIVAGTRVEIGHDPFAAVAGADAVATDTWISMGDEAGKAERLAAFDGFTVDDALMDQAGLGALFLHCLPGHWGQEATHAVAHGPRSLVLEQAENRMWTQMALVERLLA